VAETTREVVVSWKQGAIILDPETKKPKIDPATKQPEREESVPLKKVQLRVLKPREAMAADDFALAISPTGKPSSENRMRTYALCAVRSIDGEGVLFPEDQHEFEALVDRFSLAEIQVLTLAHVALANSVEGDDDPLPSSDASP
jgi:hypothetical protein